MHLKFNSRDLDLIKFNYRNCADPFWNSVFKSIEPKAPPQKKEDEPTPVRAKLTKQPANHPASHPPKKTRPALTKEGELTEHQIGEIAPIETHQIALSDLILADALLAPPPSFPSLRWG